LTAEGCPADIPGFVVKTFAYVSPDFNALDCGIVPNCERQDRPPRLPALAKLLGVAFFMLRHFDLAAYARGLAVVPLPTLAAARIPSRRAARIHPMDTLRAG